MDDKGSVVVLLSGGLDSAVMSAILMDEGCDIHALTIDYGQRHVRELAAAQDLVLLLGLKSHKTLTLDLRSLVKSSLMAGAVEPKKGRKLEEMLEGVPDTYVPARNTVMLSIAMSYAESIGAKGIAIGATANSVYPDCKPVYMYAFQRMMNLATRGMTLHTPLLSMNKAEVIRCGNALGVDFSATHSCYDPVATIACGECDTCIIRRAAFGEAGLVDPIVYATPLQTDDRFKHLG